LQTFNKICASLMKKYSYEKQYELLLEASDVTEEEILQPKSFHTTRFVSSQLRVYETMFRDWSTFYYLQEEEDKIMTFNHGNVSTRTRQKVSVQQTGDKDTGSIKLEEIKSSDFVSSLSVQQVNRYPWEYDDSIEYLKERLTEYGILLRTLDIKSTQEVEYSQEFQADRSVNSPAEGEVEMDDDEEDEMTIQQQQSTTFMEQHYHELLQFEFKQFSLMKRGTDYDLDDSTERACGKLIELCHYLVEAISKRF
ncbi:unnamed protein product, partial [Didymodactylos carnosus]